MDKHPHADLLIAIAEGRQMESYQYDNKFVSVTGDTALYLIYIGDGHVVRIAPIKRVPRRGFICVRKGGESLTPPNSTTVPPAGFDLVEVMEVLPEGKT